ncbi:MAG: CDF family Co(II)/Ni(II) efflux transporter DmeF [bacterium]
MHIYTLEKWKHSHDFAFIYEKGERRTEQVLAITIVTMIAEIVAGTVFGSMALLADGWHMGTHAAAFIITIFAYKYSKRHIYNEEFTFGTGKVSILGGFASAITLAIVALIMGFESVRRLFRPLEIHFNEAIIIAILGLLVNLLCAFLLHNRQDQDQEHVQDLNLKGAYLHVLADAMTSFLAIFALSFGKFFGWNRLDPLIGIFGALVIALWSYGLIIDTSRILLDKNINLEFIKSIREKIEADSDNRICDIHIWKVGPLDYAAIISIVTHFPKNPDYYKGLLNDFIELSHVTIEVNECKEKPCLVPKNET